MTTPNINTTFMPVARGCRLAYAIALTGRRAG